MKKLRILLMGVLSFAAVASFAQKPGKFGTGQDSVECIQNLGFYEEYYKQNDYKSAYPYWVKAMKICPPGASQNLYIRGLSIMRYFIENTKDSVIRRAKVDSLLMLNQLRMDHFRANKATTLGAMALDMAKYMVHNEDELHNAFIKASQAGREKTDESVLVLTMSSAINLFNAGKMPADKVIEVYALLSDFADKALKAEPEDEKKQRAKQDLESLFLTCNAASCETLEPLFKARFEQNPNDKELVASIVRLLNIKECTNSQLYVDVAEAYYQLDPSPASAHALARMFASKEETDKSIDYYKQAINGIDNKIDKSTYLMELGMLYFHQKNNAALAIQTTKQAIGANAQNGKAYLLLGTIWAGLKGKCGTNEIETASVFWVAVDNFARAKQVDPTLAERVNSLIAVYSQYFPLQGDAFMYDLVDGNSYTVTCMGISEKTTVRTRK